MPIGRRKGAPTFLSARSGVKYGLADKNVGAPSALWVAGAPEKTAVHHRDTEAQSSDDQGRSMGERCSRCLTSQVKETCHKTCAFLQSSLCLRASVVSNCPFQGEQLKRQ